jgi:hypothetical protein
MFLKLLIAVTNFNNKPAFVGKEYPGKKHAMSKQYTRLERLVISKH